MDTKTCSKCRAVLPLTEFTSNGGGKRRPNCRACEAARNAEYRKANQLQLAAKKKAREAAHREELSAKRKAAYLANRQSVLASRREHYKAHREAIRPANAKAVKAHYEKNKPYYLERCAARRAAKLRATPPWADRAAIRAVYEHARVMRELGFDVDVDHIVPLKSPIVCGLHVPANLQVICSRENKAKGNRLP